MSMLSYAALSVIGTTLRVFPWLCTTGLTEIGVMPLWER
jgi:hypothetical protein